MNEILIKTAEALEKNNMRAHICASAEDARKKAMSLIARNETVAVGGSETLKEINLLDSLRKADCVFLDRYAENLNDEERMTVLRRSLLTDCFIMSSNAVTENGELINVDGLSNRVAGLLFGPSKVIVIVGKNKIVKDVNEGIERVRKVAAPKNAVRLHKDTYCAKTGECVACGECVGKGCDSNSRICSNYVISAKQIVKHRIHVILCEEDLGY